MFFFKNLKTAVDVSHARGVILLAARSKKVPIFEYTPLQIKSAVTGNGNAPKIQVQKMVQQILKLEKTKMQDDAADAIAAAICCSHNNNYLKLN